MLIQTEQSPMTLSPLHLLANLSRGTMITFSLQEETYGTLSNGNLQEPEGILRLEVWFLTPKGVIKEWSDVQTWCTENDMDINLVVKPVPVAISENSYEVML